MSVSRRSPTISGRSPPTRRIGLVEQRAGRLAGHHRLDAREPAQRLDQHPVPGGDAERGGDGHVGVAGHPPQPVAHPDRGPHDVAPAARPARSRSPAPSASSVDPTGTSPSATQRLAPGRPPRAATTRAPARRAGPTSTRAAAWAEVTTSSASAVDPELAQVRRHRRRGSQRVVGDEREPHPRRAGPLEVLRRARDGVAADVDDPVQVEHRQVVGLAQRALRSARAPSVTGFASAPRLDLMDSQRGGHPAVRGPTPAPRALPRAPAAPRDASATRPRGGSSPDRTGPSPGVSASGRSAASCAATPSPRCSCTSTPTAA